MKKRKIYRTFFILAAILLLFKSAAYHENLQFKYFKNPSSHSESVITRAVDSTSIDIKQSDDRRTWLYCADAFDGSIIKVLILLSVLCSEIVTDYILLDIDERRRIRRFNNIRFNGSKYKRSVSLPEL